MYTSYLYSLCSSPATELELDQISYLAWWLDVTEIPLSTEEYYEDIYYPHGRHDSGCPECGMFCNCE